MGEQETSTKSDLSALGDRASAAQLALEVMHEIRNPLEALGHLVYLAKEDAGDPEMVRKYLGQAEEQIVTLSTITDQTLGFARLSGIRKSVDLVALAEAALRIHRRTIEAKKIHLVKTLPAELRAVVHSSQMLQVVSNLVRNAIDALPETGKLSLRLRKRQDAVDIVIADNGTGIAKEHLTRVFEPFFSTKGEAGSGLGLSLSKRIVEDHQGKVRVRTTTRPGRCGTTIMISLPLQAAAPGL